MKVNVNETVIFKKYCDILGEVTEWDGDVIIVDETHAHICYLDGHHSRNDVIPFKDIVAVADKENGEHQQLGVYRGWFRTE